MTTFVLIHGAYQGGWIWSPVAARLMDAGHRVLTPSLDGCAERAGAIRPGITTESHAEEVARLLFMEDLDDVVLAGTSSGGMVMAKVAETVPERVSRLVFADALALRHGERIADIVSRAAAITTEIARGPDRADAEGRLFKDLEPELRAWTVDRITLHPIGCFTEPVVLEKFWEMPWEASVLYCRQAQNPGEPHQRRCAETFGARWHELDTGHYPMLSTPDELTGIILNG